MGRMFEHPWQPYIFENGYPIYKNESPSNVESILCQYLPFVCCKICDLINLVPLTRRYNIIVSLDDASVTTVSIDWEDVKSIGALTAVGVGLSVGTALLYHLYFKYFTPNTPHPHECQCPKTISKSSKKRSRRKVMGNKKSTDVPVYFNGGDVIFGSRQKKVKTAVPKSSRKSKTNPVKPINECTALPSDCSRNTTDVMVLHEQEKSLVVFNEKENIDESGEKPNLSLHLKHSIFNPYMSPILPSHSPSLLGNYSPMSLNDRNELIESGIFGSTSEIGGDDDAVAPLQRQERGASEPPAPIKSDCRLRSNITGNHLRTAVSIAFSHSSPVDHVITQRCLSNQHPRDSSLISDQSDTESISISGSILSLDRLVDFDKSSIESSPLHRIYSEGKQSRVQSVQNLSASSPDSLDIIFQGSSLTPKSGQSNHRHDESSLPLSNRYTDLESEISSVNNEVRFIEKKLHDLNKPGTFATTSAMANSNVAVYMTASSPLTPLISNDLKSMNIRNDLLKINELLHYTGDVLHSSNTFSMSRSSTTQSICELSWDNYDLKASPYKANIQTSPQIDSLSSSLAKDNRGDIDSADSSHNKSDIHSAINTGQGHSMPIDIASSCENRIAGRDPNIGETSSISQSPDLHAENSQDRLLDQPAVERSPNTSNAGFLNDHNQTSSHVDVSASNIGVENRKKRRTNRKKKSQPMLADKDSVIGHTSLSDSTSALKNKSIFNIEELTTIREYCDLEWKGLTAKAATIRQGYEEILQTSDFKHIRRIRGDNYCALRSVLYKMISTGLSPRNPDDMSTVEKWIQDSCDSNDHDILSWNWVRSSGLSSTNTKERLLECYSSLKRLFSDMRSSERDQRTQICINALEKEDVKLMEGIKLLMFRSVCTLYDLYQDGREVPVFVWLLFARDTSMTPSEFLKNHLNLVGDRFGLEQVEMCVLGYSLNVSIRVYRLSCFSQSDFIATYPDDDDMDKPAVYLIAEDDRHYNVPEY